MTTYGLNANIYKNLRMLHALGYKLAGLIVWCINVNVNCIFLYIASFIIFILTHQADRYLMRFLIYRKYVYLKTAINGHEED